MVAPGELLGKSAHSAILEISHHRFGQFIAVHLEGALRLQVHVQCFVRLS